MKPTLLGIVAALTAIAQAPLADAQLTRGTSPPPIVTAVPTRPKLGLKPDLIVCKYEPVLLTRPDRNALRFRVWNIGAAASANCYVWVDFDKFKNNLLVTPLKPGEFKEWYYPNAAIAGWKVMYTFFVDREGGIRESNEDNNLLDGVVWKNTPEPARCSDGKLHQ